MWTHRTIIIPYELINLAKEACIALTGSASEGLFNTLLYKDDPNVISHGISSGYIATEFADVLPCVSYEILEDGTEKETQTEGNISALLMKLADAKFEISIEELQIMFETLYISDEEGTTAMERLGLLFANETPINEPSDPII